MNQTNSTNWYQRACQVIPSGVNSPVRAFKNVNSTPFFVDHAKGAYLIDVDNNQYIDFVNSWGALILGHAHPEMLEAINKALEKGTSYGTSHQGEVLLAEKICELMPSIKSLRMVNSGTEATMSAIRLARGFTKKNKIIKFEGCYHGHSDGLLAKAGSGALIFGLPDTEGVPPSITSETLVARFNDLESVNALFNANLNDVAAVIIEPVAGNMNLVLPQDGFLEGLRNLCDAHNTLLIFDEVITGFRVALGGAQSVYNIQPDLTTLGKIIGGGFPAAAFGGRQEIMQCLAPEGGVYQAGTLSGNPIAMAAGLATLNYLSVHEKIYAQLEEITAHLLSGLKKCAEQNDIPFFAQSIGGLFGLFFTQEKAIQFFDQVEKASSHLFQVFFHEMLKRGVYYAPSPFECGFISLAHTDKEIEFILKVAEEVFPLMKEAVN